MDNKKKTEDDLDALSPEEVKAIGEIEIGPSKQDQFLNKHYKKLIVGGVALMVLVSAGIICYTAHQQHKDAGAAALVTAATTNDAQAIKHVQDEYSGTESATTARLLEALSLLRSDSTAEQGVTMLNDFAASCKNELLRAKALSSVAFHYMACISETDKASKTKAEEAWKKVIELPLNPYTAVAYVCLGDLAKSEGNVEAARSYYARLNEVCPNCSVTSEELTVLRSQLLDVDAPVPVQPVAMPVEGAGDAPSSILPVEQPATPSATDATPEPAPALDLPGGTPALDLPGGAPSLNLPGGTPDNGQPTIVPVTLPGEDPFHSPAAHATTEPAPEPAPAPEA